MHDDLKEELIVNKVGGRFKLSTLIQKRLVALNTGAAPLVQMHTADKMAIVLEEILQDKIYLDISNDVQTRNTTTSETVRSLIDNQLRGGAAPSVAAAAGGGRDPEPRGPTRSMTIERRGGMVASGQWPVVS